MEITLNQYQTAVLISFAIVGGIVFTMAAVKIATYLWRKL